MAQTATAPSRAEAHGAAEVRLIGLADLGTALRRGWQDFVATPTQLIFLCVLYPLIGLVAGTAAAGGDLMHLLYPMAAGFALVGPIAALGLYEISRRREKGMPARWTNVFDVVRAPALGPISLLALGLLVLFVAWMWVADRIFLATVAHVPTDVGLWRALFETPDGWRMIWLGNAVGFAFALVVLVTTTLSFPMLLDRGGGIVAAIATSVSAFMTNPVPMLAWGLIVAGLLLLGSIPLFIGLAVVLPVLGHATWHLYRIVVR